MPGTSPRTPLTRRRTKPVKTTASAVAAALLLLAACAPPAPPPAQKPVPKTDEEKTVYALGLAIQRSLDQFSLTSAELDLVVEGIRDGASKRADLPVKLEDQQQAIQKLAMDRRMAAGKAAQAKGSEYLEKAAKEPGAEKTASGLVFIPIAPGSGPSPTAADTVKVNYTGKLVDGTVFDASAKHGGPATFPLGGVIPCWTEGVQKLKVGGKARLVCPSTIAYGERGAGAAIPPGATLDFEVELLEIVKQ
jgi:FKBP-type peptidyl-prolyl cis-trans isomerase